MAQKHSIYRCIHSGVTALFFSALLNITSISLVNANELQLNEWLSQASATIKKQEAKFKDIIPEKANIEVLSEDLKSISQIKGKAQECIDNTEAQLLKATEDIATLGEPTTKEAAEVVKKRRSLTTQEKELDKQLSSC